MNGHFRQIFHDDGGTVTRTDILRSLWQQYPEAEPDEIKERLRGMGYECSDTLVRLTRVYPEPNCAEEYSLDEIRAVREASEKVGGILRLAALVSELVELRERLIKHNVTGCRD